MPTLSACSIIRIYSKVEDYEIEEKMAAASTSTFSRY